MTDLPQHGFARISKWDFLGKISNSPNHVQVDLGLSHHNVPQDLREKWPFQFGLIYSVNLSPTSIETKMVVRNEGKQSFNFNLLFHTYFKLPVSKSLSMVGDSSNMISTLQDISKVKVVGLNGLQFKDKVQSTVTESGNLFTISGKVDRTYIKAPHSIILEDDKQVRFYIEKSNLEDVVVWNPWSSGSAEIADFEPKDGWKNMLCVEAGSVAAWQTVEPDSVWEGGQIITATDPQ